ncbi:hypothetical protein BX616_004973 [Lobosporangium transversale]|nr:hypothetical protein BX616_004973 [Lobosporangium transversale]
MMTMKKKVLSLVDEDGEEETAAEHIPQPTVEGPDDGGDEYEIDECLADEETLECSERQIRRLRIASISFSSVRHQEGVPRFDPMSPYLRQYLTSFSRLLHLSDFTDPNDNFLTSRCGLFL